MPGKSLFPAFLWTVLGFVLFGSLPFLRLRDTEAYARSEPFYGCPVGLADPGIAPLRSDHYGKGHFYASRNRGRRHKGIDLVSAVGAPVTASKSGRVARAETDKGYGLFVEMFHPDGLQTRYAHLDRIDVKPGDWVRKGQVIGTSGKTGNAINPHIKAHLHFEIRYGSSALDPSDGLLDPSIRLKQ